jgi:hypothetical protein
MTNLALTNTHKLDDTRMNAFQLCFEHIFITEPAFSNMLNPSPCSYLVGAAANLYSHKTSAGQYVLNLLAFVGSPFEFSVEFSLYQYPHIQIQKRNSNGRELMKWMPFAMLKVSGPMAFSSSVVLDDRGTSLAAEESASSRVDSRH